MDASADTAKAEHEPHSCCESATLKILQGDEAGTTVYSGGMGITKDRIKRKAFALKTRPVNIDGDMEQQNQNGLGLMVKMLYFIGLL